MMDTRGVTRVQKMREMFSQFKGGAQFQKRDVEMLNQIQSQIDHQTLPDSNSSIEPHLKENLGLNYISNS